MDTCRLRYGGRLPAAVVAVGRDVVPDELVEFAGRIVEDADDHYLIESGNPPTPRAWPKSLWFNETPPPPRRGGKEG